MSMTPQEALQKFWGYASFRPKQLEIITSVLEGKDTFALLLVAVNHYVIKFLQ